MNVMHASMEITDEFYSNLNDGEVQNRIGSLGKKPNLESEDDLNIIKDFLEWRRKTKRD